MRLLFIPILLFLCIELIGQSNKKPNVLFIIIDDLRTELGSYGVERVKSPNIDSLSNDFTKFNQAYVTYPLCMPSRASMLSGLRFRFHTDPETGNAYPSQEEVIDRQPSIAQTFHENGYYTASIGKVYHNKIPESETKFFDFNYTAKTNREYYDSLWDVFPNKFKGGKAEDVDLYNSNKRPKLGLVWGKLDTEDESLTDGDNLRAAIQAIDAQDSLPFFVALGFLRPHTPLFAPKKYFDLYRRSEIDLAYVPEGVERSVLPRDSAKVNNGLWNEGIPDSVSKDLIIGYLACVSYVDALVGTIIRDLKRSNKYDNTIIVVWGDNGFHLTDHGLFRKNTAWRQASHVPLLIKTQGQTDGFSTNKIFEAVDLYPTLVDMLDLEVRSSVKFSGISMAPFLKNPSVNSSSSSRNAFIAGKSYLGLVSGRYHYLYDTLSSEMELYDLSEDPNEWNDLSSLPVYQHKMNSFKRIIVKEYENLLDEYSIIDTSDPRTAFFPVPTEGTVYYNRDDFPSASSYELYDLSMRRHAKGELFEAFEISFSQKPGLYFLRLLNKEGKVIAEQKIIIKY